MGVIFDLLMFTSWALVGGVCICILYIMKKWYIFGYEECYKTYHRKKKVSSYEEAVTPYECGWNKAYEEIYNRF